MDYVIEFVLELFNFIDRIYFMLTSFHCTKKMVGDVHANLWPLSQLSLNVGATRAAWWW